MAGKKIVGRKRHLLVDTEGLIFEGPRARRERGKIATGPRWFLIRSIAATGPNCELIWADGGYAGDKPIAGWMAERFWERSLRLENRPPQRRAKKASTSQAAALGGRCALFGWLNNFRRLSKDYEFRTDSS